MLAKICKYNTFYIHSFINYPLVKSYFSQGKDEIEIPEISRLSLTKPLDEVLEENDCFKVTFLEPEAEEITAI